MAHVFKKNKIPNLARTNRFLRPFIIGGVMLKALFGGNPMNVESAIDEADWEADTSNKLARLKLKLKLVYYRYAYEFSYREFLGLKLENKSRKECLGYVPSYEKMRMYDETAFESKYYDDFLNKKKTYDMYAPYFKRDVAYIESIADLEEYKSFCSKHRKFIVKPVTSNNGRGIFVVDFDNSDRSVKDTFFDILSIEGALLEEFVIQCEETAQFHPQSVNTMRLISYFDGKEITIVHAMVRFGMGGSVVDNASSGGVVANVDTNTGIINSDGYNKKCQTFKCHPDTNIAFKGVQLPHWNDFMAMLNEMVRVCPEQKLVGWDFVYGQNGWCIIEANAAPGIFPGQIAAGHGFRDVFSKTIFKDTKHWKAYTTARL